MALSARVDSMLVTASRWPASDAITHPSRLLLIVPSRSAEAVAIRFRPG